MSARPDVSIVLELDNDRIVRVPQIEVRAAGLDGHLAASFGDDRNSAIGGLTGSLAATGIPENAARVYAVCIRAGQTLLSVHANDFKWIRKAMKIFEQTGAKDIIRTPETEADCRHQAGPSPISGTEDDL